MRGGGKEGGLGERWVSRDRDRDRKILKRRGSVTKVDFKSKDWKYPIKELCSKELF